MELSMMHFDSELRLTKARNVKIACVWWGTVLYTLWGNPGGRPDFFGHTRVGTRVPNLVLVILEWVRNISRVCLVSITGECPYFGELA